MVGQLPKLHVADVLHLAQFFRQLPGRSRQHDSIPPRQLRTHQPHPLPKVAGRCLNQRGDVLKVAGLPGVNSTARNIHLA